MNLMALCDLMEYLLKKYIIYTEKTETAKKNKDDFEYAYYDGKTDLAFTILKEYCDVEEVKEVDDMYVATNGVCTVRVKKDFENEKDEETGADEWEPFASG